MSTFFSGLKQKRDFEPSEQVAQTEQPRAPDSFFSSLKHKREMPRQEPEINEFADRPESFKQRAVRGVKDVAGQSAVGFSSGLLGSYGNLSELAGLNAPQGYINPGEKAQYQLESNILDKMNKPGYKPTAAEIYSLSGDDDIAPRYSRLPTSKDISETIEQAGGPGEATTPEGSYARRASEIYGGGASFGVFNPAPAFAAAAAGEGAKALGGGPLIQAGAEIAAMLLSQGRSASTALTSKNPAVKARIDALKNLGYTEQDITLAINAEKSASSRVKNAKATSGSEKAFEGALGRSEGLFNEVLESSFPGVGKGVDHLHQAASDAYGAVAREAKGIKIRDASRFEKTIDNVTQRVRNTLGENPEASEFLKRLSSAAEAASTTKSADTYINFYKELNRMGKWMNPKEKEQLITHVKNGIKSTFRNSGKEGKELANKFEGVNKGIQKAYQAEAVSDLLQKAQTAEGIDWKKTLKLFDKQSTWETLERGLGAEQAKNLHKISKAAKDISDFSKVLGSKSGQAIDKAGTVAKNFGFLWSILEHNPKYAAVGIAFKGATTASKAAYARAQTRLLTDPKFQNLSLRAMEAVKSESPRAMARISQEIQKIAEEEGVEF